MTPMQRSSTGGGTDSLISALENNASYRILLAHYAKSIYSSNPAEARKVWRLLGSTPMKPQSRRLGTVGPWPVYRAMTVKFPENVEDPDTWPKIPWYKHRRRKDCGKGRVEEM